MGEALVVTVTDNEVLDHLAKFQMPDQTDAEGNRLMSIGLAVVKRVQASQDVDFVKREAEKIIHAVNGTFAALKLDMMGALATAVENAKTGFDNAGKAKVDQLLASFNQNILTFQAGVKGDVDALKSIATSNLADVKSGVELAGKSFDPNREDSYFGKVRSSFTAMVQAMEKQFDEKHADSFASKIRVQSEGLFGEGSPLVAKVLAVVQESEARMRADVVALREEIARKEGEAQAMELASQKGFAFEEELESKLSEIARNFGDVVEYTGDTTNGSSSKKGDFLYRFSEGPSFVVEAKDEAVGVKPMLAYMAEAMKTRNVSFGILVVRKPEQLQKQVGEINIYDNVLFVAVENLAFAVRWARLYLTRVKTESVEGIDKNAVLTELKNVQQSLAQIRSVKQKLTLTSNAVNQSAVQIGEMLDGMKEAIDNSLTKLEEQVG